MTIFCWPTLYAQARDPEHLTLPNPVQAEVTVEDPPNRKQHKRDRIQSVGLISGSTSQLIIPTLPRGSIKFSQSALVGLRLETRSDYRYSFSGAYFSLGFTLGYNRAVVYAMGRFDTHQLFLIGRKPKVPESVVSPAYARVLRFYLGFSLQLNSYSGYLGQATAVSSPFLDLRANLSLALISNASGRNSLEQFALQPRSPNAMYRRGYDKSLYYSWGFILNAFSLGIGDHSRQNLLQRPTFLLGDWFALEFFYSRLRLPKNFTEKSRNLTYHWRLEFQPNLSGSTNFQVAPSLNWKLEFLVSYAWTWRPR